MEKRIVASQSHRCTVFGTVTYLMTPQLRKKFIHSLEPMQALPHSICYHDLDVYSEFNMQVEWLKTKDRQIDATMHESLDDVISMQSEYYIVRHTIVY